MSDLTKSEKISLGTKEIAKRIRNQLKDEFKTSKFSVTMESFSMGSAIHISLMESDIKIIKDFSEIPEEAIVRLGDRYAPQQLKEIQEKRYHQLNRYALGEYDPVNWNNGVFLTETGHNLFKRVCEIVNQYHYDESDPMTDYSCTNFYLHLNIGKWNKDFIQN